MTPVELRQVKKSLIALIAAHPDLEARTAITTEIRTWTLKSLGRHIKKKAG